MFAFLGKAVGYVSKLFGKAKNLTGGSSGGGGLLGSSGGGGLLGGSKGGGIVKSLTGQTLGENLKSFIYGKFNFTCLGHQAYTIAQGKADVAAWGKKFNDVASDANALAQVMTEASKAKAQSDMEITRYRSACSKKAQQQLSDFLQTNIDTGKGSGTFTEKSSSFSDYKGANLSYTVYTSQGGSVSQSDYSASPTMFNTSITPDMVQGLLSNTTKLEAYAAQAGKTPDEMADELVQKGTDIGLNIYKDGNGHWQIGGSAGNMPQTSPMTYAVYGGLALLAYKMFFKKK